MVEENAFDRLRVGTEFGPLEYSVTAEAVEAFAEATEDYGDWYMKDSPFGGPIAHPTLTATDYGLLLRQRIRSLVGLHARQETQFYNPIRLGKKLTVTGKITERYRKRGREYFVLEYRTVDEEGQDIMLHRITSSIDRITE